MVEKSKEARFLLFSCSLSSALQLQPQRRAQCKP